MLDILQPIGAPGKNTALCEYGRYVRALTIDSRSNLPNVAALRATPHRMGVILRALAVWEPQARLTTTRLNEPVQLVKDRPKTIEEIEDTLSDHRVWPLGYYTGKGVSAVVVRTRNQRVIRLTTEGASSRIKSRYVLPAEETAPLGNTGLRYEMLRLANTSYVSWHHAQKVSVDLALEGNYFWDKAPDNIGFVDKKIRVIDGGATWSQAQILTHRNEEWYAKFIEDYSTIRRERGLPEFLPV